MFSLSDRALLEGPFSSSSSKEYQVTVLVRRESTLKTRYNVETVLAPLDECEIIEDTVVSNDIIIHAASSRHLPSVEAILAGLRRRAEAGNETIYIHISGATHLADDSAGSYRSSTVFDDERSEEIDSLPAKESRLVDLAILSQREALGDRAKIAIVTPPLVYGVGPETGRLSIQLPALVRYALKHGYSGQIGQGLSVWSHIHVRDLALGYMTILQWMERTPAAQVSSNPWWFCENGEELSWNECAAAIGSALHQAGRVDSTLPKTIPPENYNDLFGGYSEVALGSNSRQRATRLR